MRAVFSEGSIFKEVVNTIASILNEGLFEINEDGLKFRGIDASNVCLIDLKVDKEAFSEFEANESEKIKIKLDSLKDALKKAKKTDTIILETDDKRSKLKVTLKGSIKRTFTIPLINDEGEEVPEPELKDFKVSIEIDSKTLKDAIETIETVSENTIFEATEDSFILSGNDDLEEAIVEIDKTSEPLITYNIEEPSKAMYGNDYLKKIIKASKIAPSTKIKFATEYPLVISFENSGIRLSFVLAPKLD